MSLRNVAAFLLVTSVIVPAHAESYALLIAVWDYDDSDPRVAALSAPENDLTLMLAALMARGFEGDRIEAISNPTKAQTIDALRRWATQLSPDDRFLWYFSGHGAKAVDVFGADAGDEALGRSPDQNDEALLLVDAEIASPQTYLLDDEINALFSAFRTRNIVCVIDACFAGDVLKNTELGSPKGVSQRESNPRRHAPVADLFDDFADVALLLAAGAYDEPVREITLAIGGEQFVVSPMTFAVYRQAVRATARSFLDFHRRIVEDHRAWRNITWRPVLEGPEDRFSEPFGERFIPLDRNATIRLRTKSGKLVDLTHHRVAAVGDTRPLRLGK